MKKEETYLGQKVVCVESFPHLQIRVGEIYTVGSNSPHYPDKIFIREVCQFYFPSRFSPLKSTSIEDWI